MFTTQSRRSLAVFVVSLACIGLPSIASANHSWGGYHWARSANPFPLTLGNNLSGVWSSGNYLNSTATWWNTAWTQCSPVPYSPNNLSPLTCPVASPVALTVGSGGALANVRKCSPTAGRVEVCNTTYGRNGWLGVAQIWISGGHITQGTVKLNDTYFNTSKYNPPAWRNLVICQEVGHTFGLDHQDENFSNTNLGTCMDYTSNPLAPDLNGNTNGNQFPNYHDFQELGLYIYAHSDSTSGSTTSTTSPGKAPSAATPDMNDPSQWGKLIRESNGGRTAVYELDLGAGRKIITFVIRA
jgi:hypothetical protein